MKPKNIKEFRALVERYETITLKEIKAAWEKEAWEKGNLTFIEHNCANALTGFGHTSTCTLCSKGGGFCESCIYSDQECCGGINEKTYFRIWNASTPRKLLNAFKARAKHLRENYSKYLK